MKLKDKVIVIAGGRGLLGLEFVKAITNNGAKANGEPAGKNSTNICKPCFFIPIIFIPIKKVKAKPKVIIIWLVIVNAKGIIPNKLEKSIKKKIQNKAGKYWEPSFLIFSETILK